MNYGQIFQDKVGRPATDYETLEELEQAVEETTGRSVKVSTKEYPVITKRGYQFRYRTEDLLENFEKGLDDFLKPLR